MPGPLPRLWDLRRSTLTSTFALFLFVFCLYADVRSAYADVAVGGGTGDFLQFEVGGRPAGMAGAGVGTASGVTAQFWNPAGLATLDQQQVGAMHATWLGDLSYEWLGYARPVALGVGSLSAAYFHMPSIQGTDEFGQPTEEFRVYDLAITAGLARSLGHGLSVGANAKLIRQTLATVSATGGAVDLGAALHIAGATFGAAVQNLGPDLSFDGSSYPLSRQVRLGVSRDFVGGRLLLATDYNIPSDYYQDARFGAEVRAHPNVSLRVGYRREFGTADPATGFSYGMGIHFKQLELDYAMTPSDEFDDVHRLSFGYSFGSTEQEKEPKKPEPEETKPAPPAPTGPPVIAQSKPEQKAPKPAKSTPSSTPSAQPGPAVAVAPTGDAPAPAAPSAKAPAVAPAVEKSSTPKETKPPKEAPAAKEDRSGPTEYAVVLPGYPSKESAQAEMKALELLGFRTKDAEIVKDPKRGGYMISFKRTKSKGNAEEVASDLQRMSFRAMVELVQR